MRMNECKELSKNLVGGGGVLTSPLQAIKMMLTQIDITVLKIDLDQNSIKTTL